MNRNFFRDNFKMIIGITAAVILVVGTVIAINAVHDSKSKDATTNGIVVTRNLDVDGVEYELPFMEGNENSGNSDSADRDRQNDDCNEKAGSIPVDATGLTGGNSSENHVPSELGNTTVSNTLQTISPTTPTTGTSVTSAPAAGTTNTANSMATTPEQNSSSGSNPSEENSSDSIYEGDKSQHEMPLVIY